MFDNKIQIGSKLKIGYLIDHLKEAEKAGKKIRLTGNYNIDEDNKYLILEVKK